LAASSVSSTIWEWGLIMWFIGISRYTGLAQHQLTYYYYIRLMAFFKDNLLRLQRLYTTRLDMEATSGASTTLVATSYLLATDALILAQD